MQVVTHLQFPFWQVVPERLPQLVPVMPPSFPPQPAEAPQCVLSVKGLMHEFAPETVQSTSPEAHAFTHRPFTQYGVAPPQTVPHVPQFWVSVWKLVQNWGVPVVGHWFGYWLVDTHKQLLA